MYPPDCPYVSLHGAHASAFGLELPPRTNLFHPPAETASRRTQVTVTTGLPSASNIKPCGIQGGHLADAVGNRPEAVFLQNSQVGYLRHIVAELPDETPAGPSAIPEGLAASTSAAGHLTQPPARGRAVATNKQKRAAAAAAAPSADPQDPDYDIGKEKRPRPASTPAKRRQQQGQKQQRQTRQVGKKQPQGKQEPQPPGQQQQQQQQQQPEHRPWIQRFRDFTFVTFVLNLLAEASAAAFTATAGGGGETDNNGAAPPPTELGAADAPESAAIPTAAAARSTAPTAADVDMQETEAAAARGDPPPTCLNRIYTFCGRLGLRDTLAEQVQGTAKQDAIEAANTGRGEETANVAALTTAKMIEACKGCKKRTAALGGPTTPAIEAESLPRRDSLESANPPPQVPVGIPACAAFSPPGNPLSCFGVDAQMAPADATGRQFGTAADLQAAPGSEDDGRRADDVNGSDLMAFLRWLYFGRQGEDDGDAEAPADKGTATAAGAAAAAAGEPMAAAAADATNTTTGGFLAAVAVAAVENQPLQKLLDEWKGDDDEDDDVGQYFVDSVMEPAVPSTLPPSLHPSGGPVGADVWRTSACVGDDCWSGHPGSSGTCAHVRPLPGTPPGQKDKYDGDPLYDVLHGDPAACDRRDELMEIAISLEAANNAPLSWAS
ncbi:hypothetical protein PLESTF_001614300 [Pleodorina starrii]|nr:hypothetical protein PLESTF_001614300 [Pleodorina starrii]